MTAWMSAPWDTGYCDIDGDHDLDDDAPARAPRPTVTSAATVTLTIGCCFEADCGAPCECQSREVAS